jgi:hypothetical protein
MRKPMKNEDCGKPVMKLLAHSRFHWDMIVFCDGPSHDHEDFGILQMLEFDVHIDWFVQCHVG